MDNLSGRKSFYMKDEGQKPKKKRKWLMITLIILAVFFVAGGVVAFKTGYILNKVSTKGGLFNSLIRSVPGVSDEVK
jgi:hypothetical protein